MANMQGGQGRERIICRLFIRHRCTRGDACPFYHPEYSLHPETSTVTWLNFCKEFKMGQCLKQDCRFFHITREEEDIYRLRKDIAPTLLEQAMRKALLLDVALTGTRATCKGFLQGGCTLSTCPYRHISRSEFANEVLNTLRNEFEIVLGASGTDVPGSQQQFPAGGVGVEPNSINNQPPILNNPIVMPGGMNNGDRAQRLEVENEEIYKALDPNQKANSLEEIRARLLTLQAALQWKDDNDSGKGVIGGVVLGGGGVVGAGVVRGGVVGGGVVGGGVVGGGVVGGGVVGGGIVGSRASAGFIDDGLPPGMSVVEYGHTEPSFEQTDIDFMRRRDTLPMNPMYARNDVFQGNLSMAVDNFNAAPMELDQDDGTPDKESDCKLFIGGLDTSTETNTLRTHFSKYGDIVDAIVMRDKKNRKSRGFGFVTFLKNYMAMKAALDGPHRIDGKLVDTKFAKLRSVDDPGSSPKRSEPPPLSSDRRKNHVPKLFVGGLSDDITTDVLTSYFQRYGRIVDAVSMQDPKTRRPRGFGFVEFEEDIAIQDVLADGPHQILGCNVTVDRSQPRDGGKRSEAPASRSSRAPSAPSGGGGGGESSKMFVGGLNVTTNEDTLKDYFTGFGHIVDATIQRDNRGVSKGYGFITFADSVMVDVAHDSGPHEIDGRRVDTGYASHRPDKKKEKDNRVERRERQRSPPPERRESKFPEDGCKMYVGNIPKALEESDLEEHFSTYGGIRRTEIKPGTQNNNKGYGFVTFEESHMVDKALADTPHEINGYHVDTGRAVSKGGRDNKNTGHASSRGSRDNKNSDRSNDRRNNNRGSKSEKDNFSSEKTQPNKLFVGGLHSDSTEESLYDHFCKYGEIKDVKITTDDTGTSKGFGFVTFGDPISVREAMEDGPHEIDGKNVKLGAAHLKPSQERKDGDKRRRDQSSEPPSLTSKRKAEKRSHLD